MSLAKIPVQVLINYTHPYEKIRVSVVFSVYIGYNTQTVYIAETLVIVWLLQVSVSQITVIEYKTKIFL